MRTHREDQLRLQLAREAARLMYEEGVSQYLDAKQIAARRLLGSGGARRLRHRPRDLPSNGEIQAALRELADRREGPERQVRLFAMRLRALEAMRALDPFDPRLIGSVATGHARRGSDIDLHVFADSLEALEAHLDAQGWAWTHERVTIRYGGTFEEFDHIHLEGDFPLELSVYDRAARRVVTRSSTDGKPIERLKPAAVERLLEEEHAEAWARFQRDGFIEGLESLLDEGEPEPMTPDAPWTTDAPWATPNQ